MSKSLRSWFDRSTELTALRFSMGRLTTLSNIEERPIGIYLAEPSLVPVVPIVPNLLNSLNYLNGLNV